MLARWQELTNYLREGYLEIDNNRIENNIRPFALGKNNWMFAGSPRGARAGAIFYSLIATCKANQLDPFAYFNYLLNHIRTCRDKKDYEVLLPFNIDPTLLKR
jgi:transposase